MSIPERFDQDFLYWLRERTENVWRNTKPKTLEDYIEARVGGFSVQQGTHWLNGLSDNKRDNDNG